MSNLSIPLLGLVDAFIAGHLPTATALAAVGVCGAIFSVVLLSFNFLRMGTTGHTAQAHGRGDVAAEHTILGQSLLLAVIIGASLVMLSGPIRYVSLGLVAPPPEVLASAEAYFDVRIVGAPCTMINLALAGWFLGRGQVRTPVWMLVVTNATNAALDVWFVPTLGWGVEGLAWATVFGELAGSLVGALGCLVTLSRTGMHFAYADIFQADGLRALLALNADLMIRTLCLTGSLAFFAARASMFGGAALAANALLLQLQALASYGLDGFAHAAEVQVGQAIGAGSEARTRRAITLSLQWSLGVAAAISIAYGVAGTQLIGQLTDIPEVQATATKLMPWMIASPIVSVWSYTLDGIFIGGAWSRDMRDTMVMATAAYILMSLGLQPIMGHHGLWLAFLVFLGARAIGLGTRLPARLRAQFQRNAT